MNWTGLDQTTFLIFPFADIMDFTDNRVMLHETARSQILTDKNYVNLKNVNVLVWYKDNYLGVLNR